MDAVFGDRNPSIPIGREKPKSEFSPMDYSFHSGYYPVYLGEKRSLHFETNPR